MELVGPKIRSSEATELTWRVAPGQFVSVKQMLGTLTYEAPFTGILAEVKGPQARDTKQFSVKAGCSGKVIHLANLEEYRDTGVLGAIHPCLHEQSFGGLCAQCGLNVDKLSLEMNETPHVDFGIASTGFKVHAKAAKEMEFQRSSALREQRRLILVLDLDQTVLHTVAGRMEGEEVHYFTQGNFSTFLRPHLTSFLEQLKELYEIYVYTMGTRPYAELMCGLIDPEHTFVRQRIISNSKSLRQLLPSDDSMMIILDDSEEVWPQCPNLILADKFLYFGQHHEEVLRFNSRNDVFLTFMAQLLIEVHKQFYAGSEDVTAVLAARKLNLFSGCVFVFSGMFPVDEPPEKQQHWLCALEHGAECRTELDSTVTHLIAEVDGTKKTRTAKKMGIQIVHRLWLVLSVTYWQQLPVSLFTLEKVGELQGPQLLSQGNDDSPEPSKRLRRSESPD